MKNIYKLTIESKTLNLFYSEPHRLTQKYTSFTTQFESSSLKINSDIALLFRHIYNKKVQTKKNWT